VPAGPSLYRRHRPRTFADVVGQEHVVRTLRNAIEQGKVHHAYLFVGSRGTGKTSMAKMLAACLNCERGATTEPCGTCESCVSIASATSMDVIEMDAASNNSVDDIRELRDSVQYAPVSGRYKVYILDEAHMLSPQAWNAFLKTLEEPPPSTIFVLATTEAHKVMPTVVDRCHRFDFRRPTVEQLAAVVQRVAAKEDIEVAPDAVALVARGATGSYRDALGTLEQLVTYSGRSIATEDVLAVLGVADDDLLFGSLDAVAANDARAAWHVSARLAESGRDAATFLRDLEGHARDVMVVQTLGEVPSQLAMTPDRDGRLAEQAGRVAPQDVVRLLDLLAAGQRLARDGADAQTQLEVALVKAAAPEVDPSTRALLARLERLEGALAGTRPAPPAPPAATSAPAAAAPPAIAPAAPPVAVEPPAPVPAAPPKVERSAPAPAPEPEPGPAPVAVEPRAPTPAPTPAQPSTPAEPADVPDVVEAAAASGAVAVAEAPAGTLDLATVGELWPAVLDTVRERHAMLGTVLAAARPVAVADRAVTLAFDPSQTFLRRKAEDPACRELVQEAFRALLGVSPRLEFELRDRSEEENGAGAPALSEDEWVSRFKQAFDAEEIVPEDGEDQA
jgi:DNA polymerase-3 subunit gamma/tau